MRKRGPTYEILRETLTEKSLKTFWRSVNKIDGGCWEWIGGKESTGYGKLAAWRGGVLVRLKAHRVSYAIAHGETPTNLVVCHRCDNPGCVNPDHLFLGTHQDNSRDMAQKGRAAPQAGHNNPRAKLTEEQVVSILADSRRPGEICKDYGVGKSAITNIKNGHRWAHVARDNHV